MAERGGQRRLRAPPGPGDFRSRRLLMPQRGVLGRLTVLRGLGILGLGGGGGVLLLKAEQAKIDLLRTLRQEVPKEMLLHLLLPLLAHPTWAMALEMNPRLYRFPKVFLARWRACSRFSQILQRPQAMLPDSFIEARQALKFKPSSHVTQHEAAVEHYRNMASNNNPAYKRYPGRQGSQ